ncbi:MAG: alpha-galactosidase [Bifidobacterium sp.]|nr:alpha-galactosidase [Bifidobacterium sp.]
MASKDGPGHAPMVHVHGRQFHLTNGLVSYIFEANEYGKLLNLYFGAGVPDREDFDYLVEYQHRPMSSCPQEGNLLYSLEHLRQEFPEYGASDYRRPAISVRQPNGSAITNLEYTGFRIIEGKPGLSGLPALYVDSTDDAKTLEVVLLDKLAGLRVRLWYSVIADLPIIARSARVENIGAEALEIERLVSFNLDLPDADYEMTELTGAWARERNVERHRLHSGTQTVESLRASSGHFFNPVSALARPGTNEHSGQVVAAAFIYSGSYEISAQVDTYGVTRLQVGFDDFDFHWHLGAGETFQTPEALMSFTVEGYNGMSQTFHDVVRKHLVRGPWRDKERPILINNWEATYFDFDEDKLVSIARKAHDAGVELFVLDDGWFGDRQDDTSGLGDWYPNPRRLPHGLKSLVQRINDLGMLFGLWFEPEMISKKSKLYEAHPDWVIRTPGRAMSHGRNEYVLNFADDKVVDGIYEQMKALLSSADISYIKWDMNRNISEGYDATRGFERQGELFHRYVLGVYKLHELLLQAFPNLLIEGCSSGGGRFDLGMLYYTPQIWASDNTDAVARMKIQYGTSMFYPLGSMGSHVSIVPNHQSGRVTPLCTRASVAMFGTFGYELDLARLSTRDYEEVKAQIAFFKRFREVIHAGVFYRLVSPFEGQRDAAAWMAVSEDRRTAIVGDYHMLAVPNSAFKRLYLEGLDAKMHYKVHCTGVSSIEGLIFTGSELMKVGMVSSDASSGESGGVNPLGETEDFASRLFVLSAQD